MKSIRSRILVSYIFIILLTIFILEVILAFGIRQYYYGNIEEGLSKQAEVSSNFYNQYLKNRDLRKVSSDLIDNFSFSTNAEVQIVNNNGILIADSIGRISKGKIENYKTKKFIGNQYSEQIMSISEPLKSQNNINGYVRFVTSLEKANIVIARDIFILISIGLLVLALIIVISIKVSNTITKPIREITEAAVKIAEGNYSYKTKIKTKDEIGKLAETLNYMTDEITKAEGMKNDFIASVSHELRTPLTSIKGWAITLESGELDNKEEIRDGLKIIEEETERLSGLVEELLDFSKLSGGKIKLQCEICDLEALLKQVVKQMKPRAIRQNINLIYDIKKLPQITIDRNRITQVIINIMDNSFKFTPQDGEIKISALEENKQVIIKISDSGIGIKEEDKGKVMKKFYKGNSKYSGSGLGLAICKEIITLHGGSISLESEEGKGTEITIVLM